MRWRKVERWELVECDHCGFLYQYSVSVTELLGLQAAMFSIPLALAYTYTCATHLCISMCANASPPTLAESTCPPSSSPSLCIFPSLSSWFHHQHPKLQLQYFQILSRCIKTHKLSLVGFQVPLIMLNELLAKIKKTM